MVTNEYPDRSICPNSRTILTTAHQQCRPSFTEHNCAITPDKKPDICEQRWQALLILVSYEPFTQQLV